ncbi:MAG: alpha/beta hydrolase fold protein [Clostridiales bacterium]|nr:alpha/beta hydrolase fold protein [Clostridiales bacterium]
MFGSVAVLPVVQTNGADLYFEVYGKGEPVVFIHGIAITSRVWDFQKEEVSKSYKMVVYDLRGSGRSEKTPLITHTAELLCDDLLGLLNYLGIESTNIVGLSLGAAVALKFAIKYPQRVKKMVLSGAFTDLDGVLNLIRKCFPKLIGKLLMTRFFGELATKIMLPSAPKEELLHYHKNILSIDRDEVAKYNQILASYSITSALRSIAAPTLLLYGQYEPMMHKYGRIIVKNIPDARLEIIPGVGHGWNGENPDLFNKKIMDFFK